MSRKHFQALADALLATRPTKRETDAMNVWLATVDAVANKCGQFNAQFDYHKFKIACGAQFLPQ